MINFIKLNKLFTKRSRIIWGKYCGINYITDGCYCIRTETLPEKTLSKLVERFGLVVQGGEGYRYDHGSVSEYDMKNLVDGTINKDGEYDVKDTKLIEVGKNTQSRLFDCDGKYIRLDTKYTDIIENMDNVLFSQSCAKESCNINPITIHNPNTEDRILIMPVRAGIDNRYLIGEGDR